MNSARLGENWSESDEVTLHTVVPSEPTGWGSRQLNTAPPQGCTSTSRCTRYHSRSRAGSLDLKKIPPIPVTRDMSNSLWMDGAGRCAHDGAADSLEAASGNRQVVADRGCSPRRPGRRRLPILPLLDQPENSPSR